MKKVISATLATLTIGILSLTSTSCKEKEDTGVRGFQITDSPNSLDEGETYRIRYQLTPEDADCEIVWTSSDEAVATVSTNGRITALRAGRTTITGRAGKFSDSFDLRVNEAPITAVRFNSDKVQVKLGKAVSVYFTTEPQGQNPERISWIIDDPDVASISVDGEELLVTGLKVGRTTVLHAIVDGEEVGSVEIVVLTTPVESITLNKTELRLKSGETFQLIATVNPEDADDPSVSWKSSNEAVATVSETGLVTLSDKPVGGYADISATAGGKKAVCRVQEDKTDVTSVSISGGGVSKDIGETVQLSATVSPSNATYKTVTWSSKNENVATVDASGRVTIKKTCAAVDAGSVTITATADGKSATTTISIKKPSITLANSTTATTLYVKENASVTFDVTATITPMPTDLPSSAISWSIGSGSEVATISRVSTSNVKGQVKVDMNKAQSASYSIYAAASLWGASSSAKSITAELVPVSLSFAAATSTDRNNFGEVVEKNGAYYKALPYWNSGYTVSVCSSRGIALDQKKVTATSPRTYVTVNPASGSKGFYIETERPAESWIEYSTPLTFTYTAGNGTTAKGTLTISASQLAIGGYCTTSGDLDKADAILNSGASGSWNFRRVPKGSRTGTNAFARLVTVYLNESGKATWVAGHVRGYCDGSKHGYSDSTGQLYVWLENGDPNVTKYFYAGSSTSANKQKIEIYSHPHTGGFDTRRTLTSNVR